jgi:hypothetical protein
VVNKLSDLAIEVADEYARWHTKTSSIAVPNRAPNPTIAREHLEALERVLARKRHRREEDA